MCGIDGAGGRQYKAIETTLEQLKQKSYIIKLNKHVTTSVSWVSKWYLDTSENVKSVKIQLDPDMKPYLLRLKDNYTKYEYAYTLRMTHKATPRLYELLKSYHYDKLKHYDKSFDVDELRALLDADDKESYKQFRYFRLFVLEPAIEEINEQTDILVSITPRKQGRTIVEVMFHIEPKPAVDILDAAGQTYQAFGYNIVGSSVKAPANNEPVKESKANKKKQEQKKQTEQQPKEKSKAGTELKEEIQLEQPQETAEKPTEPLEYNFSTAKKNPYTEKLDPAQKEASTPAAQDAEPAGKPKRIQIRIFLNGKKDKPIKCFSSYDRTELDVKANQWLKENGYPLYSTSVGTSFRWEVE